MLSFDSIGVIVVFVIFSIEFGLAILHKSEDYVLKDMKSNLMIGVLLILAGFLEKGFAFGVFAFAYNYAFFKPEISWGVWVACFLCCDFIHYIYHWLGHKTAFFWASHVTHHSSKVFNLTVGFRINCLHLFYRFLFWVPLCFIGFPPEMILFFESLTAVLNFMVHTEKVGKLGVLDWIFNTPSNHRVHHATNPQYIDKNYGGVLMLYDHLFGTYVKETEKPIYGITNEVNLSNPIRILLHEYINLLKQFLSKNGIVNKIQYLFSLPN
ncbi:sterol desaturase family protein [Flavobacterium enshiense]|uniref:sterol desaturase family protein n=1 Tax=Flavobacterium enshiense TaxID=1341165 RepID=UPI00345DE417